MFFSDFASYNRASFQNPATPIAEGIIDLHHAIFFWGIIISIGVFLIICMIYMYFYWHKTFPRVLDVFKIKTRMLVMNAMIHGTIIEIVWTITPSIILVLIALPSFALLYSIDEVIDPEETVKVIGNQWYWTYEQLKPLTTSFVLKEKSDLGEGARLKEKRKIVIENNLGYIPTALDKFYRANMVGREFNGRDPEYERNRHNKIRNVLNRCLFLTTIPGEDFSDQMLKELEELPALIEENRVTYDAYILSHSYMAEPPAEMFIWIKENTANVYKTFDSYMVPVTELLKGDLRLLEVDNPLRVETHKHIRFLITASDVLHSFAVPSLGIKVDAVPGRLNQISAFITREGVFYGQCSELCGVNHGFMPIKIIGVHVRKFE